MIVNGPPDFINKSLWILSTLLLLLIIYYLINIGNKFLQDKKKIQINNKTILLILGSLVGFYILIKLFGRYSFLFDIVFTLIGSMIIAYALNPIINFFEKKNINRFQGVLLIYLIIIAVLTILAFSVMPRSVREIKRLVNNLPTYFEQLSNVMDGIYSKYYSTLGELPPAFQGIESVIIDNISRLESSIVNGLKGFITGVVVLATKIVSIVLTPILTLYFLVDKDYFKDIIINIIPKKHREDTLYLATTIDTSLRQFIRGRLFMSLYVGIAVALLLLFMGIDFAIFIGFITGLFDIVPYIGPFIGFLPAFFFALISSPMKALWVSLFFILIQWVENNVIAPKVIGENMGMHPMVILLSIIIGGGIFGVFGMILSVPVVAIVKIIVRFKIDKMQKQSKKS